MRKQIERDRVRINCSWDRRSRLARRLSYLLFQFFYASGATAGNRLETGCENAAYSERTMQRIKCHQHYSRCAVWIRD